jgi:Uma2 family endonuclease
MAWRSSLALLAAGAGVTDPSSGQDGRREGYAESPTLSAALAGGIMGLCYREEVGFMSQNEQQCGVRPRRFSKAEYYRLGELGFFRGQRVELMEGQLMVLSPQNAPHATAMLKAATVLQAVFGSGYHARPQLPLDLGQTTEPEPDLAIVVGTIQQYATAHPTSAVLIVEVSDTTLAYDRHRKGSLYARAGIADYWVVNLRARHVEVYRAPIPDALRVYGYRYSSRTDLLPGATVSPLVLPQAAIPVADLLP